MTAEATSGHQDVTGRLTASAVMPPQTGGRRHRANSFVWRYRTEIAASPSSVFSTLAAFPLDSVKTRMQTYQYRGFLDCVKHTYHTEKLAGFFRGVTAPMASITLVRTVSFSIYQRAKYVYSGWVKENLGYDIIRHVNKPGTYPNLYSIACFGAAGATAGSVITFLACPFELTKLSAQVSVLLAERAGNCQKSRAVATSYQNKGTLRTMANIIKHRGILGLYTGFRLHLLRDTLGTSIYFMVYESGKQLGTTFGGDSPNSNKLAVVAAGGMCGLVSWAMIYPIDSAKSIYQRNSLLHSRGETVEPAPKIEFFKRHMYRGLGVSMSRSCVVNAIFFSSFEFVKKRIKEDGKAKAL
ncbi:putative mitochondrial carrier C29A3.11c [Tolypocladium ophioglossoides CBS 100239]|uniref:Putative mitochondrial carrier C29A3.11c n=1 Tax=Tolypocladium ophioglossoides (strain CBS 100239) TaxID=1163406 RepID=A0A0L0NJZ7_TOLOC|nr:putative mitochondrial carrier C29A3.11c [Tolypocladium ophioglossoides CBS 100239]